VFLPLVGQVFLLALPAPLAYARYRYGVRNFLVSVSACMVLGGLAPGSPVGVASMLAFCVCGYALGGSFAAGERFDRAVFMGALAPLVVIAPLAGLYFLASGQDPWALLSEALRQGTAQTIELYRRMGMSAESIREIKPALAAFTRAVRDYLPAIAIYLSASVSFISCLLLRRHVRGVSPAGGAGTAAALREDMSRWAAPEHAVWGVIAPGFMMLAPVHVLRQAGGNLLLAFAIVYLFQGLAVVAYFFGKWRFPPVLRAVGFALVLLQPVLASAMWGVGLFDTWADFRKIRPKAPPKIT